MILLRTVRATKRCPTHYGGKGAVLPVSAFHRDGNALDSHRSSCKACVNEARRLRYAKFGPSDNDLFSTLRWRAQRHQVPFNLTLDQFREIIARPCAYGGGTRPALNVGVDRKDPGGPYMVENLVACCGRHNTIKSDLFTFESMQRIVREFEEAKACGDQGRTGPRKARSIS